MILDLLITFVLAIFVFYPSVADSLNTIVGKLLFLVFTFFVVKQNAILGLVAGIIFMFQFVKPTSTIFPKSTSQFSLLPLDESIRSKDSNCIPVDRNSVAPPREELTGSIQGTFANNTNGSYTQFNL
jgi:hypothetical protein